jgi:hypothetical protein
VLHDDGARVYSGFHKVWPTHSPNDALPQEARLRLCDGYAFGLLCADVDQPGSAKVQLPPSAQTGSVNDREATLSRLERDRVGRGHGSPVVDC